MNKNEASKKLDETLDRFIKESDLVLSGTNLDDDVIAVLQNLRMTIANALGEFQEVIKESIK